MTLFTNCFSDVLWAIIELIAIYRARLAAYLIWIKIKSKAVRDRSIVRSMDCMLFNNRLNIVMKNTFSRQEQLCKIRVGKTYVIYFWLPKFQCICIDFVWSFNKYIYIYFFSPFSYLQYKTVSFLQVHWKPRSSQIGFKRSRTEEN